jgi:trehalose 6-phosphate phosphatase
MRQGLETLPPTDRLAWLLDLDGTLIDIAPAPDQVVVPDGLAQSLRRLRTVSGDAVAIVTGRPIAQVDALLGDAPYAVAGEHGTSIRHRPGAPAERQSLPEVPSGWVGAAHGLVAAHRGAVFEPKAHGFVLHYRAIPEAGAALREGLEMLLAGYDGFRLLAAKMAWEIRPAGTDKGVAVAALMQHSPFAGRLPVFIGDDVTDEDGMREAVALGGFGLRVGEAFATPDDVRCFLAERAACG